MDENTAAITKSLSRAVADITDIVHKLFGPLADEFGQMMGDKAYEYRVRNLISVMKRVKKMFADNHIDPNSVQPRLLLPIAEAASVEEDETIQRKWAGLLATASVQPDMSPSFAEVLKQLSPVEAKILDSMYDEATTDTTTSMVSFVEVPAWDRIFTPLRDKEPRLGPSTLIAGKMPVQGIQKAQLILRNFERLGLVSFAFETQKFTLRSLSANNPPVEMAETVVFTRFALEFVKACKGPQSDFQK